MPPNHVLDPKSALWAKMGKNGFFELKWVKMAKNGIFEPKWVKMTEKVFFEPKWVKMDFLTQNG